MSWPQNHTLAPAIFFCLTRGTLKQCSSREWHKHIHASRQGFFRIILETDYSKSAVYYNGILFPRTNNNLCSSFRIKNLKKTVIRLGKYTWVQSLRISWAASRLRLFSLLSQGQWKTTEEILGGGWSSNYLLIKVILTAMKRLDKDKTNTQQ